MTAGGGQAEEGEGVSQGQEQAGSGGGTWALAHHQQHEPISQQPHQQVWLGAWQ